MFYYIDGDKNGFDSVQDILNAHSDSIRIIDGGVYEHLDRELRGIIEKIGPEDVFVFDTITSIANTLRGDAKLGNSPTEDLWAKRGKWLEGDKNYLTVYDMAEKMLMRNIKNIRNRGARVIVLAHETEKVDEQDMGKKRGPDVNDAFYGKLMSASSDVFRLSTQLLDVTDATGRVVIPYDTRILELRRTPDVIAKYHVTLEKSPEIKPKMMHPTLPKLYEHLEKKPSFMTIYGSPGVGKTTFAFSEFITKTKNKKG